MSNSRTLRRRRTIRIPETDEAMVAERRRNLPASRDPDGDDYRIAARTSGQRGFAGRARALVVRGEVHRRHADQLEAKGKLRSATDHRLVAERKIARAFRMFQRGDR